MYTEQRNVKNELVGYVRDSDEAVIPINRDNRHFRQVEAWIAGGNTPSPDATLQDRLNTIEKNRAFKLKRDADLTALGNREMLISEVDSMNNVPEIRDVVRKLAEIVYTEANKTID